MLIPKGCPNSLTEGMTGMLKETLMLHKGVWDVFRENGYKAYFVGGCVRDALIGRTARDIDIATDAMPEDVKKLFDNNFDTGLKFGTITVEFNGFYYDVTTLRMESGYSNLRHPDNLEYTDDIKLDLKRRDFSVNAMAFNFDEGHIDLFNGVTDLNKKSIRAVGDPNIRFKEDALRMLRAIRFACELGFTIESVTLRAIEKNASGIKFISKERIYAEFIRAVTSRHVEKMNYFRHSGLGRKIHPQFKTFDYHKIPNDRDHILRLAYLMKRKETAINVLEFLKGDKNTIFNVLQVLEGRSQISENSKYCIRKLISSIGIANAKRVLILKGYGIDLYMDIIKNNDCTSLADLALDGSDLITTDVVKEGIDIRHVLNRLLDEVLKDPAKNRFEILLPLAREIKKEL